MDRPAYNLRDKLAGVVDVQFSPLPTPMVAWYTWVDDSDVGIEQRAVLGVLLRHEVNAEGEVIGSRVEMAVQYENSGELCAAGDPVLLGDNEDLVGI